MELHEFPGFEHFTPEQAKRFREVCDASSHQAGKELMTRGKRGEKVFFLVEGEVEVFLPGSNGPRVLNTVSAPAVLGEMGFLNDEPRSASVRTLSDVRLLGISYDALRASIADADPNVLMFFVALSEVLARRLTLATDTIAELEATAPRERVEELRDFRSKLMNDWSF